MDDTTILRTRLTALKHDPVIVSTEALDGPVHRTRAECRRCHAPAKILHNMETGTVMVSGPGTAGECPAGGARQPDTTLPPTQARPESEGR